MKPPTALTMGEPTGICPEITQKAWRGLQHTNNVFYVRGSPELYENTVLIERPGEAATAFKIGIPVIPLPKQKNNAVAVIASIQHCVEDVQQGHAKAIVTNPVQKEFLYDVGFNFPGHTEFLGDLTGCKPVMMLACEALRVVPATIHLPLKAVAAHITIETIISTAEIILYALKTRFQLQNPRLAVAGLNPHAGENGHIGQEEQMIIEPAIQQLQAAGHHVTGPFPADTLFHEEARKTYDAVLCMYHDQALIPIKTLDFWGGVNVTLGLPFLRTSPDHGTGINIAGRGIARADSLINALKMAHQYG